MIQGDKNMGEDREGRAAALLPILIFLLIFLGSGFITGDFYSMPAIVAFLIALLAALVQNRELGFSETGNLGGHHHSLAPIAAGISQKTGFSMAVCAGAVVGGAMFGDNLSMISDTTIAAVKTQGCEMKDKFRENFLIVLPAAIVTILLFLVLGKDASFQIQGSLDYSLLRVMLYLVVLAGVNVFLVLMTGTVLSLIAGVATGAFGVGEMFTHVGEGITGMYDITVISVIVACIVALVKEYGGIAFILSFIKKRINGERGGELGIAALALLVDMCTANNTVAIVMAGPIAKEISADFGVTPRRSASLLDMFSSMGQGLIPYGAQLLAAAGLTGLTPFEIIPYCFYPILMGVSGLIFIFIKKRHGKVLV